MEGSQTAHRPSHSGASLHKNTAEMPISVNRIVHTMGNSHAGGESGGCRSSGFVILPALTAAEIPPTAKAIAIETA